MYHAEMRNKDHEEMNYPISGKGECYPYFVEDESPLFCFTYSKDYPTVCWDVHDGKGGG
jgi:hypothetical protein